MKHYTHLEHPALRPVWESLQRDWRLKAITSGIVFLLGLLVLTGKIATLPIVLLLGAFISLGGAVGLGYLFRNPSDLERLQDLLYDNPADIVWVYTMVLEHHPFGLDFNHRGIIYFKLSNGDEISASVDPSKLRLISKVFSRALPGAVFGYTEERAEQFSHNPRSLGRW